MSAVDTVRLWGIFTANKALHSGRDVVEVKTRVAASEYPGLTNEESAQVKAGIIEYIDWLMNRSNS